MILALTGSMSSSSSPLVHRPQQQKHYILEGKRQKTREAGPLLLLHETNTPTGNSDGERKSESMVIEQTPLAILANPMPAVAASFSSLEPADHSCFSQNQHQHPPALPSFPFPLFSVRSTTASLSSLSSHPSPHPHSHTLSLSHSQCLPPLSVPSLPYSHLRSLPHIQPHQPIHTSSLLHLHHFAPPLPSASPSGLHHHLQQHQQQQSTDGQQQPLPQLQQRLLLYRQQQQQFCIRHHQNALLRQQQAQQQQQLLQRQHQQKQKLAQQQKEQLQQLHQQMQSLGTKLSAPPTNNETSTQDYHHEQQQQMQMTTQPLLHLNLATQQHGASAPCTTTSPISPTTPSVYPSLQQRRASLLQQQQQRTSPTLSLSSAPTAELTSATSPPPLSISNSNFNKNSLPDSSVPLARTPSLPLTPQEYQGLVASGALPVRQALQTHIATSGEKPPETKEEARAALEAMFQIRADKIRRSIEQGKLATAEALQHKVIKRRESIVDVTQKTSSNEQHYHRDRSLSAPMERVTFAAAFNTIASPQQPQRQSFSGTAGQWFSPHNHISDSATIASSMASQEPVSMYDHSSMPTEGVAGHMLPGTGGIATITGMHRDNQGESMVVDSEGQHTTFGLSDDDLMCSFTHFTAKLSDSLLARDFSRYGNITAQGENASIVGPSHPPAGYNSYSSNLNTRQDSSSRTAAGQEPAQESMLVDTALPNLSPTASNESQSSSPWIPWHRTMTVEGGEQNTIAGTLHGATGAPMAIHPFAQSHSVPQPSVISVPASTTASLLPIHSQQIQVPITLAAPQLQQQGCPVMYTKDPRDQGSNFQQYNPSYSSSVGFDVHPLQMHPQEGFGAGGSQGGGSCVGEKQTEAWNQYVQYLLHQQELAYDQANPLIPQQQQHQQPHPHVQQGSFNHQQESGAGASYINTVNPQVMDPHWQATMMTMMMDQNPKNEAVQGLGQQTGYCISTSSGTNLSL